MQVEIGVKRWFVIVMENGIRMEVWVKIMIEIGNILSQPNNNHNPNNKTTITVVELRQSNHWEPPGTQNL